MKYTTSDQPRPYKAYAGNNKTNIFFTICSYSLVQKFLPTTFLIVVCGICLLFTVGLRCTSETCPSAQSSGPAHKVSGLPHNASECLATVTTLGMNGPVTWHPIDDAMPNWEVYRITPLMLCQRASFGDKHTISLDLDEAKFQSGEQLGFILVKNNGSPVYLVKHLLETFVRWPDQHDTCRHINDYLILPGVIKQGVLQSEYSLDSSTYLNSYSNIYCYVKKDHHYRSLEETSKSVQASQSSLESNVATQPVSPLSKSSVSLDAFPMVNDVPVEASSIHTNNTNGGFKQLSLWEELAAGGYDLRLNEMGNNSSSSTICQNQDADIEQENLLETLKNLKVFKKTHENIIKKIKETVPLNHAVKNKRSLSLENKIQLALPSALEAIKRLKSLLKLEQDYQLGICYSRPTNLNMQHKKVIEELDHLKQVVQEEQEELSSKQESLNLVIESLENRKELLVDISRSLQQLNTTDDIGKTIKKLFIGNNIELKEMQKRIEQLEQMEDKQKSIILGYRKGIGEMEEMVQAIQTDLIRSVTPLQEVIHTINALKRNYRFGIASNIAQGRVAAPNCIEGIIELVAEDIQDIQTILNRENLRTPSEKIEEVVNKALDLENRFQTKIQSKAKKIVDQTEAFKKLLPKRDARYDSKYEEEV